MSFPNDWFGSGNHWCRRDGLQVKLAEDQNIEIWSDHEITLTPEEWKAVWLVCVRTGIYANFDTVGFVTSSILMHVPISLATFKTAMATAEAIDPLVALRPPIPPKPDDLPARLLAAEAEIEALREKVDRLLAAIERKR